MTSIKIIAHNLIFIYHSALHCCLLELSSGCVLWSLPRGPRGQSTCGHLKWSRGRIVAPSEALNRLGSYKEPHTSIIGSESEISSCGELGASYRGESGSKLEGLLLIKPGWILFKFPFDVTPLLAFCYTMCLLQKVKAIYDRLAWTFRGSHKHFNRKFVKKETV